MTFLRQLTNRSSVNYPKLIGYSESIRNKHWKWHPVKSSSQQLSQSAWQAN